MNMVRIISVVGDVVILVTILPSFTDVKVSSKRNGWTVNVFCLLAEDDDDDDALVECKSLLQ